jgi:hypothetical protein
MNLHKPTRLAFVALLTLSCSFETAAVDKYAGTSCGHYELSRMTTEQWASCWKPKDASGACFMSARGACGPRESQWPSGTLLVQWCPIGNPGTEVTEVEPCDQ